MVAINFNQRFANMVQSGKKRQTVRRSDHPAEAGKKLQLYTGQRTKDCRKLVYPDPVCLLTDYCAIRKHYITFGNRDLHPRSSDDFAKADGFENYDEMYRWFAERYEADEFVGKVIKW